MLVHLLSCLFRFLLPKEYPKSVNKEYRQYVEWNFISDICASLSFLISTQTLLIGMGVKEGGVITIAATVNWMLKDVIGPLGGLVTIVNFAERYDSDVKITRIYSSIFYHMAAIGSTLTIAFPKWFLIVASISNIARNASLVSVSSTRAALMYEMSNGARIGDLTARAHAQRLTAVFIGQALGAFISFIFSIKKIEEFLVLQVPMAILGVISMHLSMRKIVIRDLNGHRLMAALKFSDNCTKVIGPVQLNNEISIFKEILRSNSKIGRKSHIINYLIKNGKKESEAKEIANNWIDKMMSAGWRFHKNSDKDRVNSENLIDKNVFPV